LTFAYAPGMAITRRQRELYDFLSRFVAEKQYSPSFEEIKEAMGLNSLATGVRAGYKLRKKLVEGTKGSPQAPMREQI
jgi:SOS-response transcriptional repressor LexA